MLICTEFITLTFVYLYQTKLYTPILILLNPNSFGLHVISTVFFGGGRQSLPASWFNFLYVKLKLEAFISKNTH